MTETFRELSRASAQIDEAQRQISHARTVLAEHLTTLQDGLDEVMEDLGREQKRSWHLPGENHIGTWVDRANRTVWMLMEWNNESDSVWFAVNTNNFTGTGYPIAWAVGCYPSEVYRPGNNITALEATCCSVDML